MPVYSQKLATQFDIQTITFISDTNFCVVPFVIFHVNILVPTSTVSVTAPNTQTVGQSLTLQCEVTTVRGITSRVDIVWSSDGTVFEKDK